MFLVEKSKRWLLDIFHLLRTMPLLSPHFGGYSCFWWGSGQVSVTLANRILIPKSKQSELYTLKIS